MGNHGAAAATDQARTAGQAALRTRMGAPAEARTLNARHALRPWEAPRRRLWPADTARMKPMRCWTCGRASPVAARHPRRPRSWPRRMRGARVANLG